MLKAVGLLLLTAGVFGAAVPVAIFHGLGDMCMFPGMSSLTSEIGKALGAKAECIEIGNGSLTSWFDGFQDQAKSACASLQQNPDFKDAQEFSVLGLSQGALIARYIIEKCELKGSVRNYVSIGGPQQGVAALPHCSSGIMCDFINGLTDKAVYFSFVQDHVGPAGYFKDPKNFKEYSEYCKFLPGLNNEASTKSNIGSKFANLNHVLLIMFTEDTMVYPKESEWFWEFDENKNLIKVEDTNLYKNDEIGLKGLMDANKVDFVSIKGDHLQFSHDDLNNIIIPALQK